MVKRVSDPESLQAKASRSDMQRNCETDDGLEFVTALIIKSRLRYVLRNMDRLFFFTIPHFVSIRKKSDGVALLNSQVLSNGRSGKRVTVSEVGKELLFPYCFEQQTLPYHTTNEKALDD